MIVIGHVPREEVNVLVFRHLIAEAASAPPQIALRSLRKSCDKVSSLEMAGAKGYVCFTHGSAALHWDLNILDPVAWNILSDDYGGEFPRGVDPPPHDGPFPVLSF